MGKLNKSVFKSALDFNARHLTASLETIAQQKSLLAVVKTALPSDIAPHILHCVHSGARLLIYSEAACWASQIRFFNDAILKTVKESGQLNISIVTVKISPPLGRQVRNGSARRPSMENIRLIREHCKSKDGDDILAQALLSLAKTLEKRVKL